MKAFFTESLLVTESALFWMVALLIASAIVLLIALWEQARNQDKRH